MESSKHYIDRNTGSESTLGLVATLGDGLDRSVLGGENNSGPELILTRGDCLGATFLLRCGLEYGSGVSTLGDLMADRVNGVTGSPFTGDATDLGEYSGTSDMVSIGSGGELCLRGNDTLLWGLLLR